MPKSITRWFTVCLALSCSMPVLAEEEEARPGWRGELEVGLISTSGNSETQSFNANIAVANDAYPWRHELRLEALHSSDQDVTTAERYTAALKSDYRLDDTRYLFGTLRYEDDRFSGYDYRVSETIGYGHRVLDSERTTLELEVGAGGRHVVFPDGEREDEPIVRAAGSFLWQVSPSARLSEHLFVESGDVNTFTQSETGLKLKINSNLATKISYTLRHNSDVPPGTEKTDTVTAVTLVLDF